MRAILIFLLFAFMTVNLHAQKDLIKKRWFANIDYSSYKTGDDLFELKYKTIQFGVNRGISKFVDIGLYYELHNRILGLSSRFIDSWYGVNSKFHFTPLLIKSSDFRFDLYASGSVGGVKKYKNPKHYPNLSFGGGLIFYPFLHWGVNIEYNYDFIFYKGQVLDENTSTYQEKIIHNEFGRFKFGLSLKF